MITLLVVVAALIAVAIAVVGCAGQNVDRIDEQSATKIEARIEKIEAAIVKLADNTGKAKSKTSAEAGDGGTAESNSLTLALAGGGAVGTLIVFAFLATKVLTLYIEKSTYKAQRANREETRDTENSVSVSSASTEQNAGGGAAL